MYRAYIDNRLKSYGSALARLPSVADELLKTAGIFWDQGLFFEVHEILEPVWMKASGAEKLLLQALIRSAGVYIYLELGYRDRAAKIAAKTIPVLKQNRDRLRQDLMADELIAGLEALAVTPPFLTKEAS